MRLFDLIKEKVNDPKGVISDSEICVINRRDFIYSETSASMAFLKMFNAEASTYEMHAIIDFLHAATCKIRSPAQIHVFAFSPTMVLPALAVNVLVADLVDEIVIFAPRGLNAISTKDDFASSLKKRFENNIIVKFDMSNVLKENAIKIILCNSHSEAEVTSALKAFEKVDRGLLLIKGYGRYQAPNCGDLILSSRINVHCSLAGFGFSIAL